MVEAAVGIHVRTRDRVAVLDALRTALEGEGLRLVPSDAEGGLRFLLAPPRGRWTTLYPEGSALVEALPPLLGRALGTDVLTVGRLEEAAFFYEYHGPDGALRDRYHSCPDYAKEVGEDDANEEELQRTRGDARLLEPLLGEEGDVEKLAALLARCRIERLRDHDPAHGPADNVGPLTEFARLLDLPDLLEGYDELCAIASDEEDGTDLRLLVYAEPETPGALERLLQRLRRRGAATQATSPPGSGAESAGGVPESGEGASGGGSASSEAEGSS
ncbi:MAG: hypothetical protein D6731_25510 [Planctomycetota bacterium]|nr:MAG: hypothetical protein D6731_25510 [Planctomycetota bacterium]